MSFHTQDYELHTMISSDSWRSSLQLKITVFQSLTAFEQWTWIHLQILGSHSGIMPELQLNKAVSAPFSILYYLYNLLHKFFTEERYGDILYTCTETAKSVGKKWILQKKEKAVATGVSFYVIYINPKYYYQNSSAFLLVLLPSSCVSVVLPFTHSSCLLFRKLVVWTLLVK